MNYQEKINEVFQKANKYRDTARQNPNKIELYKKASENFRVLSDYYSELINHINSDNKEEFVKEVFVAEKEHVDYESHFCLFMYFSQKNDFEKAEIHFSKMKKNISSAYQRIKKLSTSSSKPNDEKLNNDMKEDTLTWEYHYLELNSLYYGMKFRKSFNEENYLEALDFIRMCIEELNLLKEKLPIYMNYIGYEYKRVINSNYFAMCSNEQLDIVHSLAKGAVSSEALIEIIKSSWKAYEYTMEAVRENPVQQYKEVLQKQQDLILGILENTKENWNDLFITFEDNKEFLKIMKRADPKRFISVKKELIYEENKNIKYWSLGSLLLLIFLTIASTITIIAINVTKTWLVIPIFLTLETTFIIVSSFLIRATGVLSEAGLLELIRTAFQFQTLAFRTNKSKKNLEMNDSNNDPNLDK